MKNYTDLEQSKNLTEILLLESSDGYWDFQIDSYNLITDKLGYYKNDSEIPCWSLDSLLNVLPKEYTNSKNQVCTLHIDIVDSETPYLMWYANPEHEGSIVEIKTKEYSNLIDACYEMIVWLLENGCIKKGDSV